VVGIYKRAAAWQATLLLGHPDTIEAAPTGHADRHIKGITYEQGWTLTLTAVQVHARQIIKAQCRYVGSSAKLL
jgi:hypothetical protein